MGVIELLQMVMKFSVEDKLCNTTCSDKLKTFLKATYVLVEKAGSKFEGKVEGETAE